MKTPKNFLLSVVTVVVLSLQLMSPITVFADDEITPPPEETTEVTTTPDPTEEIDIPESASTPLPPEPTVDPVETSTPLPPEDSTEPPTVDPVETDTPLPTTDSTEAPTVEVVETVTPLPTDQAEPVEEPVTVEQTIEKPMVAEILEEIPAGTDLVILDENGEPEPLASQDAAEIIINGDPIWCPDGVSPTPTANGCTDSYDTMADLLLSAGNYINTQTVNGTIWITSDDVVDANAVVIDGSVYTNWAKYALTLQGGWSGISGDTTIGASSVFSVDVSILNWNNNIVVDNIDFVGGGSTWFSTSKVVSITNSNLTDWGYNITNVSLNEGGSTLTGSPGQAVTLAFNYKIWNPTGCPGCILQLVPGLGNTAAGYCAYHGNPPLYSGGSASGSDSHQYTAPQVPGTYYFHVGFYAEFTCANAIFNYTSNAPVIATLIVLPPPEDRDGDGIFDKDDACPDDPGVATDNPLTNGCPPIIPVTGNSISFSIDCSLFSGQIAAWPNGDRVLISCVPNGKVDIERVENTNLPDDLDAGYQYSSGFNVRVFQNGAPLSVMPEGGSIQVSFVAEETDAQYRIMYWDEGDWLLLDKYQQNPSGAPMQFSLGTSDFLTILSGTRFVDGNPNREEATTNFPGTFVLVVQE